MDCKIMQKSLIINRFETKKHTFPLKTARKSTNYYLRTISFYLFFEKIKVERN